MDGNVLSETQNGDGTKAQLEDADSHLGLRFIAAGCQLGTGGQGIPGLGIANKEGNICEQM